MIRCEITVSGVVQGVGFRYFVSRTARRLNLVGSVRNLFNSKVEIIVEGDRYLIEEFIRSVKVGPPNAHVSGMTIEWNNWTGTFQGFEIR